MIIDLKKIKAKGLKESDFRFDYEPKAQLDTIPYTELALPVEVEGTVTLTGEHSAYVCGEVRFTITGQCSRCLESAKRSYSLSFAEQADADNENGYIPKNDTIDLSKIVDDTIMTGMPMSFLCDDGCKGLCPECGGNLNKGECKCK